MATAPCLPQDRPEEEMDIIRRRLLALTGTLLPPSSQTPVRRADDENEERK